MCPEIVGCLSCGQVARLDSFERLEPRCEDCGERLKVIDVSLARQIAAARRRADQRRVRESHARELGLGRTGEA